MATELSTRAKAFRKKEDAFGKQTEKYEMVAAAVLDGRLTTLPPNFDNGEGLAMPKIVTTI